jgi:hypothetical protein
MSAPYHKPAKNSTVRIVRSRYQERRNYHGAGGVQMNKTLLTKSLNDNLAELLGCLDHLDDTRINQALIDCTMFLMIELSRLDSGVQL